MGVPPHRYVSRRRLESAKAMLATGRASLSEIALESRFSSQSSFTRAFRRATGMTPGVPANVAKDPLLSAVARVRLARLIACLEDPQLGT
jgi:AraC-like DNA-binding protein